MTRRLVIVQYAGDFAEASTRLASGGPETYRGQRYTVEFVESLTASFDEVTTVACITDARYDVKLPSGARAIGLGYAEKFSDWDLCRTVARLRPSHLVIRAPIRSIIFFSALLRCRVLLTLANSYDLTSLRSRVGLAAIVTASRLPAIEIVANHGLPATKQLAKAGAPRSKLMPWDYPSFSSPADWPAKDRPRTSPKVAFIGMYVPEKGVGDVVEAIAALRATGREVHASLYGSGDATWLRALVSDRGLDDLVDVAGAIPNDEVIPALAQADIAIVPSRRSYPEGMPLTVYESLCSRTPLIVSDHPVFADFVRDGVNALVFPSADVRKLVESIATLLDDNELYERLSEASAAAWESLQIGLKWDRLIARWAESRSSARTLRSTESLAAIH